MTAVSILIVTVWSDKRQWQSQYLTCGEISMMTISRTERLLCIGPVIACFHPCWWNADTAANAKTAQLVLKPSATCERHSSQLATERLVTTLAGDLTFWMYCAKEWNALWRCHTNGICVLAVRPGWKNLNSYQDRSWHQRHGNWLHLVRASVCWVFCLFFGLFHIRTCWKHASGCRHRTLIIIVYKRITGQWFYYTTVP